jgi:predicted metalloprotease with PDZ domain
MCPRRTGVRFLLEETMMAPCRLFLALVLTALSPVRALSLPSAPAPGAITLSVDATEAPRGIFHASLSIPAGPGPLTLYYPKWIPGEHAPAGPIEGLAGLRLAAAGKPLAWRRDDVEMYALHCEVPPGADRVDVTLDYVTPRGGEHFGSWAGTTANLAVVVWNEVLLYPGGTPADSLRYRASLRLPPGWKFGTALPVDRETAGRIEFRSVPLTTLIDSPVLAGAHFRAIPLAPEISPPHELDLAADSREALAISPERIRDHEQLVREAAALFGAMHYRRYRFLLALSDGLSSFGLEHHESSDNRSAERCLLDDDQRLADADLLPHEFAHSWNGKHRRPADIATPGFETPMKTELLWVYEGLTTYLGWVLAARSGFLTPEEGRHYLALAAAGQDHRPGRAWRPLLDTAVGAPVLFGSPDAGESWRRGVDFYDEGLLLWLDVDGIIRERTGGARSLDDFCRRFHGGQGGEPTVRPYAFDDVIETLGEVAAYDWRGYFIHHLNATSPRAPLDGVLRSGWRLVYTDSMTAYERSLLKEHDRTDLSWSLGFYLAKDGVMGDVIEGSPASRAGLGPGMKLVAVNGRRWTAEVLEDALRAAKADRKPVELLVANGDFYRTHRVAYTEGPRYPRLARDAAREDRLTRILEPRVPRR